MAGAARGACCICGKDTTEYQESPSLSAALAGGWQRRRNIAVCAVFNSVVSLRTSTLPSSVTQLCVDSPVGETLRGVELPQASRLRDYAVWMFLIGLAVGLAAVVLIALLIGRRPTASLSTPSEYEQFMPPWRDYVRDAERRTAEIDRLKVGEATPIRDEIDRVERAVITGSSAIVELAVTGQKLQRVLMQLDPPAVRRELANATKETALPPDATSGRITALKSKLEQVETIESAIEETRGQIGLLDAQLEEATVSTVALVHTGQLHLQTPQIEEQLSSAVLDVQSLQAALREVSDNY